MKRLVSLFVLCAAVPATAGADLIGVRLGVSVWGHQTAGRISYGSDYNNLKDDLGLGNKTQIGIFASLEHPIPLLPDVALRYNNVSTSGDGTLAASFGGIDKSVGKVHTELTLDQLDGILYYKLLDTVAKLRAGVDVKWIQGNVKMHSTGPAPQASVNRDFTGAIPMVYLAAGAALPFTGLSADAQGSFIAYSGNRLYDVTASLSYETGLGLGVTAGYRRENLRVKNLNDINVDATVDGPFGAVFYHF